MSQELAGLIAKKFIQRRDVKAVQFKSGAYSPDYQLKNHNTGQLDLGRHAPAGFKMQHMLAHLNGEATYGHYLLDLNNHARVFCFDIDLDTFEPDKGKSGSWVNIETGDVTTDVDVRSIWADRKEVQARAWIKYQMKMLATMFAARISEMGWQCAATYSGSKGVHVYGFTGDLEAKEVRDAALLVMDALPDFELMRGKNFFQHNLDDPSHGYRNFTVEIYPKQDQLPDGNMGNLLRLPLGKNLKSADPTFFLDLTGPMAEFKPHADPVRLLEEGNPFL